MSLLSAPTSVFISLTYRCNLACRHCAVYSSAPSPTDLDTASWLTFFEELVQLKVFRVHLSGGEPFMRPDIWHLLDALDAMPLRFAINTNATLIDAKAASRLKGYRKLDDIMVSLDGASPATHDRQRGPESFARTCTGIDNLVKAGLAVSFYCTVTRINCADLERITELATTWKVAGVKFNQLLPEGRGLANWMELRLGASRWQDALQRLRALKAHYGPFVCGTILDQGDQFDVIAASDQGPVDPAQTNTLCGCGALIKECAVRPDGWITPCDRLPDLKAGHINEHRFADIWRHSALFNRFRQRRTVHLSEVAACQGCTHQSICTGGCPATPVALAGDFMTRDPLSCYRLYSGEERVDPSGTLHV